MNAVMKSRRKRKRLHKFMHMARQRIFKKMRRKVRQNLPTFRVNWEDHLQTLREDEFRLRYRMPKVAFDFLLSECSKYSTFFCQLSPHKAELSRRLYGCDPVDPRHKLAAAIRWFAGGSYLDIRLVHGMSKNTLYKCVWEAVDAINSSPQLSLKFPWDDEKELEKLERGFASLSKGKVRGCIFSLDGFCVRIHCPRGVVNPRDYYHRKGFYTFVVQAVVDAVGKFRASSIKAVGSTHDSLAFQMSDFYDKLEKGNLARPVGLSGIDSYFGMGDDAYANRAFLCTPWPGRNLSIVKDSYNYFQSLLRIVVECAFGRLVMRWGCLWRALCVAAWRVPALINALMKLHNLCDENSKIRISKTDVNHFIKTGQAPCVFANDGGGMTPTELHEHRSRRRSKKDVNNSTRQAVTDHLASIGARRPPHSRFRSKSWVRVME